MSGLSHEIPSGEPLEFEVNTENTKDLPVSCIVSRGGSQAIQPTQFNLGQQEPTAEKYGRIHKIRFVPRGESGESLPVQILYGGMPIKGSPFALKIARSTFPENVRILPSDSGWSPFSQTRRVLLQIQPISIQPAKKRQLLLILVPVEKPNCWELMLL